MNRHERRASLARVRSTRNAWHPFERVDVDPARFAEHAARTGDLRSCWRNNVYSVQVFARATPHGEALQFAIRRHDDHEVQGWSDLQRIKDELAGPDALAIEMYPRAADVVDDANMRHLFVLPPGMSVPFTIQGMWS